MATVERSGVGNHEVVNQPPPLAGYDVYAADAALARPSAARAPTGRRALAELGNLAGGGRPRVGRLANEHPPELRTHDRYGERVDEVEFHPAWHALMARRSAGLQASPWAEPRPGAHVARRRLMCWSRSRPGSAARSR